MPSSFERKYRSHAQRKAATRHAQVLRMAHGEHVADPNHTTLFLEGVERAQFMRRAGKRTLHNIK